MLEVIRSRHRCLGRRGRWQLKLKAEGSRTKDQHGECGFVQKATKIKSPKSAPSILVPASLCLCDLRCPRRSAPVVPATRETLHFHCQPNPSICATGNKAPVEPSNTRTFALSSKTVFARLRFAVRRFHPPTLTYALTTHGAPSAHGLTSYSRVKISLRAIPQAASA